MRRLSKRAQAQSLRRLNLRNFILWKVAGAYSVSPVKDGESSLRNSFIHQKTLKASDTIFTMETYAYPAFPQQYSNIHIALFKNVTNAPQIRKRLIEASQMTGPEGDKAREEVDFGFVEANLVRLSLILSI